jgi:hypothetical protein
MRFIIGYAGIPREVYDQVAGRALSIARQDGEFVGKPLGRGCYGYTNQDADYFLRCFADRIAHDRHSALNDTAFAVICIRHDHDTTQLFVGRFFPSTLVIQVDWGLPRGTKKAIAEGGNELIGLLTAATKRAKNILEALKKEVRERANKTPVLLPVRNFKSDVFCQFLQQLQADLVVREEDHLETLRAHVNMLDQQYPMRPDDDYKGFFVDDRGIRFKVPGRVKHAFARAEQSGHDVTCLLSGRRRLGAPFDAGFHYDCSKGSGNLYGQFFSCHGKEKEAMKGNPHLNIAPNDYVRE